MKHHSKSEPSSSGSGYNAKSDGSSTDQHESNIGKSNGFDGSANGGECPREQMIAEAAYFRAEQRNFEAGDDMYDWFQAELDVDKQLEPSHWRIR